MRRILILIAAITFFPILLLVYSVFLLNSDFTETKPLTEYSNICEKSISPPLHVRKSIEISLKQNKRSFLFSVYQVFFNGGTFNESQPLLTYYLAKNLSGDTKATFFSDFKIALFSLKLRTLIDSDKKAFCFYEESVEYKNFLGMASASKHYFGKKLHELTLTEAVHLASTLPENKKSPFSHDDRIKRRAQNILKELFSLNIISEEDYSLSLDEFKIRKRR